MNNTLTEIFNVDISTIPKFFERCYVFNRLTGKTPLYVEQLPTEGSYEIHNNGQVKPVGKEATSYKANLLVLVNQGVLV